MSDNIEILIRGAAKKNESQPQLSDQSNSRFYKSALSIRQPDVFKFSYTFLPQHQLSFIAFSKTTSSTTSLYSISESYIQSKSPPSALSKSIMTVPTTCCGRSGAPQTCACAAEAKCSCGKQSALQCTCEKAKTENTVAGARCSCRKSSFPL